MSARVDVALWLPVRDGAGTIDAALGSVAAQTVPIREVIVIDRGSTDGTAARAERWSGRLPLCVLRHRADAGIDAAYREAACRSDARWVASLDARNCLLPDHLSTMLAATDGNETIVTAKALDWSPGHGIGASRHARPVPPPDAQLDALLAANFLLDATLVARSAYERVGGCRYGMAHDADWDLWIRLVRSGARVVAADHATVLHRIDAVGSAPTEDTRDGLVLRHAIAEATDPRVRARAEAGSRRLTAETDRRRALDHARNGRPAAARRAALAAFVHGQRADPTVLLTMVAPTAGARLDDRRAVRSRTELKF